MSLLTQVSRTTVGIPLLQATRTTSLLSRVTMPLLLTFTSSIVMIARVPLLKSLLITAMVLLCPMFWTVLSKLPTSSSSQLTRILPQSLSLFVVLMEPRSILILSIWPGMPQKFIQFKSLLVTIALVKRVPSFSCTCGHILMLRRNVTCWPSLVTWVSSYSLLKSK